MLRVHLLGQMTVEVDGRSVEAPAGRRAWGLLAWLALHPGPHARGELAARFWPDVLDRSARASLRSAVWALRRDLGDDGGRHVVASRDQVELDGDVWVDARAFEALLAEGELQRAIELCGGELLPGFDDEWALRARDEHREREIDALERLAEESEPKQAIAYARRQVALDPMGEEVHRRLMQRLADAGDRPAALAAYERLRDRLRRELALVPSAPTRELADALRAEPSAVSRQPSEPRVAAVPGGPRLLPLVGRDAELQQVLGAWEAARAGSGGAVSLQGEPGIGKSRLAAEAIARARARGARTAACAALDLGGAPPLGLWAELAGELARDVPPPPDEAAWPDDLARLAPELTARFHRAGQNRPAAPPELERARLFEAATALVEWAARDRPLLLLMEDVHLADAPSLELAAYVGRRLSRLPVLLVLTRRPLPRNAGSDALEHALRARGVLVAELTLEPLGDDAVGALAREVGVIDHADVEQVVAGADGNALLAVEQARALARGEREPPASLRGAVRASMATAGAEARRVAELVAVAGRELEAAEIAALPVKQPHAAATEALQTGLLTSADGQLGYRHALLREAVYADLPGPHRTHLHAEMAEVLGPDPTGSRRAAEVARHLRLSGRDGEAVQQLALAGDHARAVGAIDEAAAFFAEAVELRPDDPDLLLELGEAEAWRGRREASEAAFERAEALLERAGDPLAIARALTRLQRWYNGPICYPRGVMAAAERVLEVLDASDADDPEVRRKALTGLGWAEAVAGDVDRADELLAQVQEMVGDTGVDDAVTWELAHARQLALSRRGRFRESYESATDAAERAMRIQRPDLAAGLWINASAAAWAAGDFERAEEFNARSQAALEGTGAHGLELLTLCARVHLLLRMDRLPEATQAARQAHEAAERLGDPGLVREAEHSLGLVAMAAREHARAAELFGVALDGEAAISRPRTRLARAEALAACGRCDEADQEVRATALEPVGPADFPHTLVGSLTRVQGLIARARGDRELAARRLEEAAAAWRRITARGRTGDDVNAVFADLGRPAVGLIEAERELARVQAELEELHAAVR